MRRKILRRALLCTAVGFSTSCLLDSHAWAASIAYTSGSATNKSLWTDATNWSAGVPTSADSAVFKNSSGITFNQVIDTGNDQTLQGLNYGDGVSAAPGGFVNNFSINNNTLTFTGGATGLNGTNGQTAATSAATVVQFKSQLLTNGVSGQTGSYSIGSNIALNLPTSAGTAARFQLNSANATLNLNGVLSVSPLAVQGAPNGVQVIGGGTLALNNSGNTFTGASTVSQGTLVAGGNDPANGTSTGVFGVSTIPITIGDANTAATDNLAVLTSGAYTVARNITVAIPSISGYSGNEQVGGTNAQQTVSSTFSGTITMNRATQLRSNVTSGTEAVIFSGQLTGVGGITKVNAGRVRLTNPSNNYGGSTTVTVGTLELGASGVVPDASAVIMNGGTLATGGFNEIAGPLTLSATSNIDLGNASKLQLADSSAASWTASKLLQIVNWNGSMTGGGTSQFFVGTSASLTPSQLSEIVFVNPPGLDAGSYAAQQLSTGEVVSTTTAVPEPGALGLLAVTVPLLSRRRSSKR